MRSNLREAFGVRVALESIPELRARVQNVQQFYLLTAAPVPTVVFIKRAKAIYVSVGIFDNGILMQTSMDREEYCKVIVV